MRSSLFDVLNDWEGWSYFSISNDDLGNSPVTDQVQTPEFSGTKVVATPATVTCSRV